MKIQLSDHFTYPRLLRFVLPSIVMMIFTSIYGVIDGLFVSNFVGKTAFAAINLILPFPMALGALGYMIGTGGSALIAKFLGEGKQDQARQCFSMLIVSTVLVSLLLSLCGILFTRPIALLLGATEALLGDCVLYGRLLFAALAPFMLQNVFQSFFITAEKPNLGLATTVAAGLTNIGLDYLFIRVLGWGVMGAALATGLSQTVGATIPLLFFARKNGTPLCLVRFRWNWTALAKTCTNGSSELMSNLSLSLVNMLYNFQLLRLAGADGVAAYGVIMYVNFIFTAIFFGYAIGSAPIISFHYGAGHKAELRNLFRKSILLMAFSSIGLTLLSIWSAPFLAGIFVGYDPELFGLTCHAFQLYSLSFLLSGMNIFGSSFFTALNNGLISAAISFLRTLLFQVVMVLLLPALWGLDGIWLAVFAAELLALAFTVTFFVRERKRYHYA